MRNHRRPRNATRIRPLVFATVVTFVLAGCGSGTSLAPSVSPTATLRGCAPQCLSPAGTSPGTISAGTYTSINFFPGALTVTLDDGWTALGDETLGLHFEHPAPPNWHLFFTIDMYPIEHLAVVEGIERTPEALIAWMVTNPAIIATPGPPATIGEGIPAATVDVEIPRTAVKDDPECPTICTNFLGLADASDTYGNLLGERTRIYFAQVRYGGQVHMVTVYVEMVDRADFDAVLPNAQRIIDTFRLPVDPA